MSTRTEFNEGPDGVVSVVRNGVLRGGVEVMKRCARCREQKSTSEFGINRATADRLNVYCKPCNRERMKVARQYQRARLQRKPVVMAKRLSAIQAEQKVERAIFRGCGRWGLLKRKLRLGSEQLGLIMVELMFVKRSVKALVVNGERIYVKAA